MISYLRSKFDLSDRRAIVITGDKIAVYHWRGGGLADGFLFDADDAGFGQFARYIEDSPGQPAYLVVDVVEEEYRQETVPHDRGRDRKAMLERRLTRHFRSTPYQYAVTQGREKEGRKDDRMLMTALTNPDQLDPVLRVFNEFKVPLAGIYSLPILSNRMLEVIDAKASNVLLVTLHGSSGLRQTFLHNGELRVSRLAKMPRYGSVSYAPHIIGELDKFRRYLVSLRQTAADLPVDVYIVTGGNLIGELRQQTRAQDLVRYHLVNVADIGKRLKISGALTTPYSDLLFANLLLADPPRNQYAPRHQTRYFRMHRTRLGMMAIGGLTLFGATLWSGVNFIDGLSLRQQSVDAKDRAEFYASRYDVAQKRLPATAVPPRDVDAAVNAVDALMKYKSSPLDSMKIVSQALGPYPSLQIDRIDWGTSGDPTTALSNASGASGGAANAAAPEGGSPTPAGSVPPVDGGDGRTYLYYQIAEITGHVAPFAGNYREAIAMVEKFRDTLARESKAYKVEILQLPLDVSSGGSLQGEAEQKAQEMRAGFSVRMVLGVEGNEKG